MSEDLVARWLDDRAGLSEDEAAELLRVLSGDPDLARRVKDQLATDELLSRRLAVDRRNFENQVAQRLLGVRTDGSFLKSTLEAVRGDRERRRSAWRSRMPEVAAAAILIAVLVLALRRGNPASAPSPAAPGSAMHGLRAQYYPSRDLSGTPVLRIDPAIDWQWSAGAPPIAVSTDVYSVRWRGKLASPDSGRFKIRARYDDGVRIWIDGVRMLDDWHGRYGVVDSTFDLDLIAGKAVDVRVEYFNGGDRGVLQLFWSSALRQEEIIPATAWSHD